jgi:hypothetical protein
MKKQTLLFLLVIGTVFSAQSQSLEASLEKYNSVFPQEKIYIHFDNNAYLPGALIGYKAYLMSGPEPSKLNRNFYTDWHDEDGRLIAHHVSPIALSSAYGTFEVPKSYKGQHIYVTGYTQWMLNFDTAFLFKKKITVLQTNPQPVRIKKTIVNHSLQLLPEGGNMVAGLDGLVAFKATDKNGKPIAVNGRIVNSGNEEITVFTSVHDGMGKFGIKPIAGETYTAIWTAPDGTVQKTNLPAALSEGVSMQLRGTGINRYLEIERTANQPTALRKLSILLTINQQVVMRGVINLEKQEKLVTKIPVNNFPSGTATLTILAANNQPICERLFFVDNEEYRSGVEVKTDTIGLDKRAKNSYEIILPDTIPANMSLSVTNDDVPHDSSDYIISSLLLSSDIKGYVHNPAYYFSSADDSTKYFLDLVMLTNGWRKFRWDKVLDTTSWKIKYPIDTAYLSLSGRIDGVNPNRLAKSGTINLILRGKDSSSQMFFPPITPNGTFTEPNIVFYDTAIMFYQLNKLAVLPGRGKVSFQSSLIDTAFKKFILPTPVYDLDTARMRLLREAAFAQDRLRILQQQTTLKEVVVTAKRKTRLEEMDELYTNGLFKGNDAIQFDLINDPRGLSSFTIFDYLQGRVAGLQITGALTSAPSAIWRGSGVGFFLNEMPTDAQTLSTIPMSDVAYIKTFRPPFFGSAFSNGGGAIAVYTKRGADVTTSVKGLDNMQISGYTVVKEFYEPDYSVPQSGQNKTDSRRTLYWKPNIITDGSVQKIRVSFYNNDISKKIRLVLEGVNNMGQFISVRKLLE